jgi:prepilin-type N-terminal cleavage/methylation domain-containing protein
MRFGLLLASHLVDHNYLKSESERLTKIPGMRTPSFMLPIPRTLRRRKGFTLVETIVVVAVIGVVSAIAVPQMGILMDRYRLEGAARLISADLQNARMTAIKENRSIRAEFDFLAHTYSFFQVDTGQNILIRNLNGEYPTISAYKASGGSITFTSTGETLNNVNASVITVGPSASKTIEIKDTGRIAII